VKIGIPVLEIEAADKFEVGSDSVRIVDVRCLEKREVIHLRRLHEIAQLAGGIDLVADEVDRLHAGLFAFVYGEDDIEPAVWQIDGPGGDRGRRAAGTSINILDAFDIRIDHGLTIRPARFRVDLGGQRFGLDLAVALEGDAIDDVVLGYAYDDPAGDSAHLDAGKQSGGVKILDALVDGSLIRAAEIRGNRFAVDTLVALHQDIFRECAETPGAEPSQRDDWKGESAFKYTHKSHCKTGPHIHER